MYSHNKHSNNRQMKRGWLRKSEKLMQQRVSSNQWMLRLRVSEVNQYLEKIIKLCNTSLCYLIYLNGADNLLRISKKRSLPICILVKNDAFIWHKARQVDRRIGRKNQSKLLSQKYEKSNFPRKCEMEREGGEGERSWEENEGYNERRQRCE